jgi:hypothetical protein
LSSGLNRQSGIVMDSNLTLRGVRCGEKMKTLGFLPKRPQLGDVDLAQEMHF